MVLHMEKNPALNQPRSLESPADFCGVPMQAKIKFFTLRAPCRGGDRESFRENFREN